MDLVDMSDRSNLKCEIQELLSGLCVRLRSGSVWLLQEVEKILKQRGIINGLEIVSDSYRFRNLGYRNKSPPYFLCKPLLSMCGAPFSDVDCLLRHETSHISCLRRKMRYFDKSSSAGENLRSRLNSGIQRNMRTKNTTVTVEVGGTEEEFFGLLGISGISDFPLFLKGFATSYSTGTMTWKLYSKEEFRLIFPPSTAQSKIKKLEMLRMKLTRRKQPARVQARRKKSPGPTATLKFIRSTNPKLDKIVRLRFSTTSTKII